jgi:hypothetical protein
MISAFRGPSVGYEIATDEKGSKLMIETYCMLGREREAELLREAQRLHLLGPSSGSRVAARFIALVARATGSLIRAWRRPLRVLNSQ